ncbi:uncharacterized protein LOC118193602 isoform X2 [Stegodyphus dumicola]|uniref:uncharacterized protein LOC118193602 isoform X2 n=1 Tax=Stegodyphus dumicola TaxID=202533 RepID=UPI0015AF7D4B|nr:uncharacterized protein LOC118193602 isoform X2 [Stegodyphus dumicola]
MMVIEEENDDKQEIPLESHPRHRTRPRKVFEKLSNDITNDVKEEQAESDVDILIAEEEVIFHSLYEKFEIVPCKIQNCVGSF